MAAKYGVGASKSTQLAMSFVPSPRAGAEALMGPLLSAASPLRALGRLGILRGKFTRKFDGRAEAVLLTERQMKAYELLTHDALIPASSQLKAHSVPTLCISAINLNCRQVAEGRALGQ